MSKKEKELTEEQDVDLALDILKKRWFELAAKERMPDTPKISKELDKLQNTINKLKNENPKESGAS